MSIDIAQVHLAWCIDIIKRIQSIINDADKADADKVEAIAWLVKQGLKVERED